MPILNDWIDGKLAEIANKLPTLVHTEPASFACGYNVGYKQALLDLENFLYDLEGKDDIKWLYVSHWELAEVIECEEHESDGKQWRRYGIDEPPWLRCKKCDVCYR